MNKYYFLLCSLPSVNIGAKPFVSFVELENYLDWNLTEADKKVLYSFKQYIDIKNLKNMWMDRGIDSRGNLDEKTIHEISLTEDFIPGYVLDYLKKYISIDERINNFSLLEMEFFKYEIENPKSDFLHRYFSFERETRLILTALRAKTLKIDISKELEGEDKKDPLVDNILSEKEAKVYTPPKEYEKLRDIYLKSQDNPKELYKSFLEYCFNKYGDFSEKDPFTIDQILGYLANLILVEDFYYLDQEKGKLVVDSLL